MAKPEITLKEKECLACKAFYREELIDESNRCPSCVAGNVEIDKKQEQDYIQSAEIDYLKLKEMVRKAVRELEEEKKGEEETETKFAPKPCKVCGETFTPRAPAMKTCQKCQDELKAKKGTENE